MFSLGTANRAAAAARARDNYLHLATNGWETTLARFKPKSGQAAVRIVTVGDFIGEVKANCPKRGRTLDDYIRCFRHIVADIFEIRRGNREVRLRRRRATEMGRESRRN
jgi:hypothetical protein